MYFNSKKWLASFFLATFIVFGSVFLTNNYPELVEKILTLACYMFGVAFLTVMFGCMVSHE